MNDADASFEQITTGTFLGSDSFWRIADNGVVWGAKKWLLNGSYVFDEALFAWPYSGWQEMGYREIYEDISDDFVRDIPDFEYENERGEKFVNFRAILRGVAPFFAEIGNKPIVFLNNTVGIQAQREGEDEFVSVEKDLFRIIGSYDYFDEYWQFIDLLDSNMPVALLYDISIGDTPGTAKLSNSPIELMPQENVGFDGRNSDFYCHDINLGCIQSVYIGDGFILTSDNGVKSWITLTDLKTREWRWLKQLDFKVDFSVSLFNGYASAAFPYEGRVWAVDSSSEHFGVWWFDLQSLEDGFVKFNVTLPDFIPRDYNIRFDNGKIIFSGANPVNGNTEKVIINIMTGEAVTDVTEPELLFETLISLN